MKVNWIEINEMLYVVSISCKKCEMVIDPNKCIVSADKHLLYYKGGYGGACVKGDVLMPDGNCTVPINMPQHAVPINSPQGGYTANNPYVVAKEELLPVVYCPRCGEQVTFEECVPVNKDTAENSGLLKKE